MKSLTQSSIKEFANRQKFDKNKMFASANRFFDKYIKENSELFKMLAK